MRDPRRIKRILKLIERIWIKYPDMRLGQLINVCLDYKKGNPDLFNIEDDNMEQAIRAFEDEWK